MKNLILPDQGFFTASELSHRWEILESDIHHLVQTGKLPIADLYAALRGKRHTIFKPQDFVTEPENDEIVINVRLPDICWGPEYDSRMQKARQQHPEVDATVFLLSDVLHFEKTHASHVNEREPDATTTISNKKNPPAKQKGSCDRLAMAIIQGLAAHKDKYGIIPTANTLFEWLPDHDETGVIHSMEPDGEHLLWVKGDGGLKDISRKGFANRLSNIKNKYPG